MNAVPPKRAPFPGGRPEGGVRTRFAPSPTGHLHLGGARTALYNYLFAKRFQGRFVLRIEDTDKARSTEANDRAILDGLTWLGLEADESPTTGGPAGPYRQSERLETYRAAARFLLETGAAYRCFCEPTAETSSENADASLPAGHEVRCACHAIDPPHAAARAEKEPGRAALRFRLPHETIVWHDLVRGEISIDLSRVHDPVIERRDGIPTYNFAVVVDDETMAITHVLRGDDHISNTPKQIAIARALGYTLPEYGHLSMILGADGTRLSKRHGATSVEEYRRLGFLPEALVSCLALLGWSSPDGAAGPEIFEIRDLVTRFSLDRVSRSAAIFDLAKLRFVNGHFIRAKDVREIARLVHPFLPEAGRSADPADPAFLSLTKMLRTGFETFADAPAVYAPFLESDPAIPEEDVDARRYLEDLVALDVMEKVAALLTAPGPFEPKNFKTLVREIQKQTGRDGHSVYAPLRVGLIGRSSGPSVLEMIEQFGPIEAARRIRHRIAQAPSRREVARA